MTRGIEMIALVGLLAVVFILVVLLDGFETIVLPRRVKRRVRLARLTFAMARHAAVDLAQVFGAATRAPEPERLPPADLKKLRLSTPAAGSAPPAS